MNSPAAVTLVVGLFVAVNFVLLYRYETRPVGKIPALTEGRGENAKEVGRVREVALASAVGEVESELQPGEKPMPDTGDISSSLLTSAAGLGLLLAGCLVAARRELAPGSKD